MKHLRTALAPALMVGAVLAHPARAQRAAPIAIELRGGAVTPTGGFRDRAGGGWTVGGAVSLSLHPNLDVYAGYQHDDLSTLVVDPQTGEREELDGSNTTDDGFRAGARLHFPMRGVGVRPWSEAGLLYNRLTLDIPDATGLEFDWSLGFEAGLGVAVDLAPRLELTPGVRFRYHEARFRANHEFYIPSGTSSLTVDLGLRFRP